MPVVRNFLLIAGISLSTSIVKIVNPLTFAAWFSLKSLY